MADKTGYEKEKMRMLDKQNMPSEEMIESFLGAEAWERLMQFEMMLKERYELGREIRFPFGNDYGWGFRYTHKKSLLCYLFFEQNGFSCTVSINDAGARKVAAMLEELHPTIQESWQNRYACGAEGGWVHHSVAGEDELNDLVRLLGVKVRPKLK